MTNKIGIIGAGISGLTLGCILAKDSQNCTIYEKSDGPSNYGAGISLSPKHANFIVNQQFTSSNMIEDFGEEIREKVFNQTGIMLDWEIQIIGDR